MTNTQAPRLINAAKLADKGISYSRQHLYRLIDAGKFPKPVKIGGRKIAWVEAEIDAYIVDQIKKRDLAA